MEAELSRRSATPDHIFGLARACPDDPVWRTDRDARYAEANYWVDTERFDIIAPGAALAVDGLVF